MKRRLFTILSHFRPLLGLLALLLLAPLVPDEYFRLDNPLRTATLIVLTALVIAAIAARTARGIRADAARERLVSRQERGLCPSCEYDLRATPGRCPECGTVPASDQHGGRRLMAQAICPRCGDTMIRRLIRTKGIVVCEQQYLDAMWQIQRGREAGVPQSVDGGRVAAIVSMVPWDEEKYSHCDFCEPCGVVTIWHGDVLPEDQVPLAAKRGE